MGFKLKRTEALRLAPNEEKELCIELEEEKRAAIHGVVKFPGLPRRAHNETGSRLESCTAAGESPVRDTFKTGLVAPPK